MADDQDLENDLEEEVGGGSKKLIIIIIAAVVLLGGGGAAAFFLLGGDDSSAPAEEEATSEEAKPKEKAIYVGVPNAITARLAGSKRARTVQIKMNFMVRGDDAKSKVKAHMPRLKNDVLMMVSEQNVDDLSKPEGRRALQQKSLEVVQQSMTELVGEPVVEKVLFVSFVMQ